MSGPDAKRGEPPVTPAFDTFSFAEGVASWCVTPAEPPAGAARNAWLAAAIGQTLDALGELARVWRVDVLPEGDSDAAPLRVEWDGREDPAAFSRRGVESVAGFAAEIYAVELVLDVLVHFRPAGGGDDPIRAWARLHDLLRVLGGPHPALCLNLNHSLFAPHGPGGVDNRVLHALNQPPLERALRRWEERVGPITEVEGWPVVHRYGFHSEEEA